VVKPSQITQRDCGEIPGQRDCAEIPGNRAKKSMKYKKATDRDGMFVRLLQCTYCSALVPILNLGYISLPLEFG
jgi:hypothetical protein